MPMVQKKSPTTLARSAQDVNPDEVAIGASIVVRYWPATSGCSAGRDPVDPGYRDHGWRGYTADRENTTIPTKKSQIFSTADDSRAP